MFTLRLINCHYNYRGEGGNVAHYGFEVNVKNKRKTYVMDSSFSYLFVNTRHNMKQIKMQQLILKYINKKKMEICQFEIK